METKEFSELLAKAREQRGLSRLELASRMCVYDRDIVRIELAKHNYSLKKAFQYLQQVNCCIFITNGYRRKILCTEDNFIEWFSPKVEKIGKTKFSEASKIHRSTLTNIEARKASVRIDTFLKIVDALGYKIEKIC